MTPFKTLKSLVISLVSAAVFWAGLGLSTVRAAGTVPLALSVQVDSAGNIAPGCLLNLYVAGTVATPQNAFADFGLTTPLSNPVQCDQGGRLPMFWLADGLIHIRLTTSTGTPIVDTTMQVLGPSSGGGGGGGTVDPTSIMATGDIKAKYGTGPLSGFVRCNALTIGNAVSGATERANADTQALFVYLYNTDPNLVVSGGRTGNALNDYNANKQLTMPDWRGRAIAGLADMGNSPTTALTATYFGASVTTLGAAGGNQSPAIAMANLPASPAPVSATTSGYSPTVGGQAAQGVAGFPAPANFSPTGGNLLYQQGNFGAIAGFSSLSVGSNTANLGSGTPLPTVTPEMVTTIYMKL